jgi:hypothetical protein
MNNGSEPANPLQSSQPMPAQELSLETDTPRPTFSRMPVNNEARPPTAVAEGAHKRRNWLRVVSLAILVIGVAVGAFLVTRLQGKQGTQESNATGSGTHIPRQTIALVSLSQQLARSTQSPDVLKVNGQLTVSSSLVLQPTVQPTNGITGQIYYDQTNNNIAFYNGSQFVNLLGSTVNTQVINTQVTNIFGGAGGVTTLNGAPGSIAMFTTANQLGSSLITQSGTTIAINSNKTAANAVTIDSGSGATLQIGNSASDHNIQIGTGSGVQSTALGSVFGGSATTVQGGTGGVAIATGSTSGTSGSISITTGNSATTASGNITIDTGHSVISGQVIEDKTFEGGLDNMNAWFGNTIARSSAQSRSGIYSLAETGNAANWGIIETLPGVNVIAGHQYYFSVWVRAESTPRTITGTAVWNGASGTVALTPVSDNSTGWTEMTGLGVAPGGATSVYFEAQSTGAVGEVHYFDDMTVTDLSSSSAAAVITIGSANAKIVTIGNINQIGATSIFGGSGISLNSGAAGITMNGGVLSLTGSAASNINTSSGALTLTSEAAATWGVGTANTGAGGDLTLLAGRGGTDNNNNGGNLLLQGGAPNGTGAVGGVIVKPQVDSISAFQVQNATGTPLLAADTTGMIITVAGTDTQFGTLALANAHFRVTQTTPPTIGASANCGVAPSSAVAPGSTDSAGSFAITTGTGGTASTCDTIITFHGAYGAAPKSILVVGKTDAASAARQVYVSAATATTFTISFAASAGGANSTAYDFSYWVIE